MRRVALLSMLYLVLATPAGFAQPTLSIDLVKNVAGYQPDNPRLNSNGEYQWAVTVDVDESLFIDLPDDDPDLGLHTYVRLDLGFHLPEGGLNGVDVDSRFDQPVPGYSVFGFETANTNGDYVGVQHNGTDSVFVSLLSHPLNDTGPYEVLRIYSDRLSIFNLTTAISWSGAYDEAGTLVDNMPDAVQIGTHGRVEQIVPGTSTTAIAATGSNAYTAIRGDVDLNGEVDYGADDSTLAANWMQSDRHWHGGDLNDDSITDQFDWNIWAGHIGETSPSSTAAGDGEVMVIPSYGTPLGNGLVGYTLTAVGTDGTTVQTIAQSSIEGVHQVWRNEVAGNQTPRLDWHDDIFWDTDWTPFDSVFLLDTTDRPLGFTLMGGTRMSETNSEDNPFGVDTSNSNFPGFPGTAGLGSLNIDSGGASLLQSGGFETFDFAYIVVPESSTATYDIDFIVHDGLEFTNVQGVVDGTLNADFNGDLVVDLADYSVWRDRVGFNGGAPGSLSTSDGDANGDGVVDEYDYWVWKLHFGAQIAPPAVLTAVPEPRSLAMLGVALVLSLPFERRRASPAVASTVSIDETSVPMASGPRYCSLWIKSS